MRPRLLGAIVAALLLAAAWYLPRLRRDLRDAVVTYDARPSDPAPLPPATGPGLAAVARTRVVLIDGLSESVARTLPALMSACDRGQRLRMDVGFPSVSLPVEVALWSGLTQQQTGVVTNRPRAYSPAWHGIPAQVPGSIAIAEDHGFIVRALGFAIAEPVAGETALADAEPEAWQARWEARARAAIAGPARLAFVHVLRVDTAGHHHGALSAEYADAARTADTLLATLLAAAPDARWFLLSDHGHVAAGGHGGEERAVRQTLACIVGPGPGRTRAPAAAATAPEPLVHAVDIARAIADSTGTTLDGAARGRPLAAALAVPLEGDQAIPRLPIVDGGLAVVLLAVGLALTAWCLARLWLAPVWFALACVALVLVRGEPTLSMRFVYQSSGALAAVTWIPALVLCAAITYAGLGRTTLLRVVVTQLALPVAATAAALAAAGAWPTVLGAHVAPVVPRYTAFALTLLLMTAHAAAAVALGVLGRRVLRSSDRSAPPGPPRSAPSTAR